MLVSLRLDGPVAILTISNPPVNAIGLEVRRALIHRITAIEADPAVGAVVLTGTGRMFVGGADIAEFDRPPESPHLPDVISAIERSAKPWVAALHGSTLGGGVEIALACRFRIASPDTTLGLPEVNLGIIPGSGGTQRLPRLIGIEAAIPVVAEKRMLGADEALGIGMIDSIAEGDLVATAVACARNWIGRPLPSPLSERPLSAAPESWGAAADRIAKSSRGLAAPMAALNAMRHGVENGFAAGLAHERDAFLRLRASDEAAALRHLFFAERAAPRPAALREVTPLPLRRVGVVGGGTMGAGIAAALRNAGLPVILSEQDEAGCARALATLKTVFAAAARRGLTSEAEAEARLAGVETAVGLDALADCDLVIEAVFETLEVKRPVFEALARICRPDTILATNTSYLDPRLIFDGQPHPGRFIGLHFFSPAQVMKLLEIIPLRDTSEATLATAFDLARRLGKVPVRAGICEGFIGNRILRRYRAEAETILGQGVPLQDIDAAMRQFGLAMGPFEMQDLAGLDISYLTREAARAQGRDVPLQPLDLLVRAGRKGQKTGGGWYDYAPGDRTPRPSPEAARIIAPMVTGQLSMTAGDIAERLVCAMATEGQAILDEGIARTAADIDLVEVHGYGFPRAKGGPMFWAARQSAS